MTTPASRFPEVLAIRTGRLAETGWAPAHDWRRDLVSLAEGPLPLPDR